MNKKSLIALDRIPPGQRLIPYGQLKKHWREWDRTHYKVEKDWGKDLQRHWGNY